MRRHLQRQQASSLQKKKFVETAKNQGKLLSCDKGKESQKMLQGTFVFK